MTLVTTFDAAASLKPSFWKSEFDRVLTLAATAMRRAAEHRRRSAAAAALMTLSDRDLRDLGLTRVSVHGIAGSIAVLEGEPR